MKYQGISIIRRKDSSTWYARYRSAGKQNYISGRTQQQVYDKLKEALKQKSKLEIQSLGYKAKHEETKHNITLNDWFNNWLKLFKSNVKSATIRDYYSSLKYVENLLHKPLQKITGLEILETLSKIPFARRKQKVYEILNDIFTKAEDNELINKNPLRKIEKPKHKRKNGLALSNEDEQILEDILIKNNADIYLVCLYQGLRRGEALALNIEDIDFNKKTITINKSFNQFNKIDTTKNIYSNRIMPLFNKTEEILKKYRGTQGRIFNYGYVWTEKNFNKLTRDFKNNYTIHSLRHTFITRCQEANIPLHIIQKWVGHNLGSTVTASVYTHTRELAELNFINKYNNFTK